MNRLKKKYFHLNRECILVSGKRATALYNLANGDIFNIDQDIARILRLSEKGLYVEDVAKHLDLDGETVIKTLNKVTSHDVGRYYKRNLFIEKYKLGRSMQQKFSRQPPVINRCYIKVPGSCKNNCNFCELPKVIACNMCTMPYNKTVQLNILQQFLKRIFAMHCKSLILHGGDPLLEYDYLFSLIKFCREKKYAGELWVIADGSNIEQEMAKSFVKYDVKLVIPFDGESIIGREQLAKSAKLLNKFNIDFKVTLVIHSGNIDTQIEMQTFAESLGAQEILRTIIIGKQKTSLSLDTIIKKVSKQLPRISPEIFYHNTNHHPCLNGTIAIDLHGNLLPCPHLTSEVLGHISDPYLVDRVFETRTIYKYWDLSLSKVEKCKDCGFRYGCFECRAVANEFTGNLYSKPLLCYQ